VSEKVLFLAWALLAGFQVLAWPRITAGRRWQVGTLGGVLVLAFVHMWAFATLAEDAFITFRYSLNLAQGNGPVFNVGEKVEGYSNFLWMVLLAGPKAAANVDIVTTARVLGVVCALAAVVLVYLLVRRITDNGAAGVLAATVTACVGSFAAYAGSGLETPLFVLLVLAALWFVLTDHPLVAGLFGTLATMTRPDGVVVTAVIAVWLLARAIRLGGRRQFLWFVGSAIVSVAPWMIWRVVYYGGYLLPNAVAAKSGGGLGFQLTSGWAYFLGFVGVTSVLLLMVPAAMFALISGRRTIEARTQWSIWLFFGISTCYTLFVIATGGDWMPAWRMLVLPLPLLACGVLASWAVAQPLLSTKRRITPVLVATLGVLLLWESVYSPAMKTAIDQWHQEVDQLTEIGDWLGQHLPHGTTIATFANGSLSYHVGTDVTVVDELGLTDSFIARHGLRRTTGIIGHLAYDNDYVVHVRQPVIVLTTGGGFVATPSCYVAPDYAQDYAPLLYQLGNNQEWVTLYVRKDRVADVTGWFAPDPVYHQAACPPSATTAGVR
jgi:hypothetical protein